MRQTKTARQRAEEALAAAQRRHDRALAAVQKLEASLKAAEDEHGEAAERLEYAQADPALATPATSTTTPGGTTA